MDPNLTTFVWLALGFVTGAAFFAYAKSFGRASKKVLSSGLVIAALIYVLFAAIAGRLDWLLYEALGAGLFAVFAYFGRRSSRWLAAGWGLHPLWDLGLHARESAGAAHAPEWYVVACLAFDLLVAVLILRDRRSSP